MGKEKYPNTIGAGTREYITGIEYLESLLDKNDEYNLHDSVIQWFHYDNDTHTLDMDIQVIGSLYNAPENKNVFIHFCFEDVVALNVDLDGNLYINEMELSVENNFLLCLFTVFSMKIWAKHLTISPTELRDAVNL